MNRAIFTLALALISIKGGSATLGDVTLDRDETITTDKTSVSGITVVIEDDTTTPVFTADTLDVTYALFPEATGATKSPASGTTGNDDEIFGINGLHPGTPYIIEITGITA